jgi:preprotein translocase SecE subunit
MGRALRRQQERAQRRQQRQQQNARPSARQMGMSAPAAPEGGRSGGRRFVPRWASDILSELRKVTWPARQEVMHLTLVVVIVSLFFGAILGASDVGFNWLIENTVLR